MKEYFTVLPVPRADAIFASRVLTMSQACFQAKFVYDADWNLLEWVEY